MTPPRQAARMALLEWSDKERDHISFDLPGLHHHRLGCRGIRDIAITSRPAGRTDIWRRLL
jgi:hypothetical protein